MTKTYYVSGSRIFYGPMKPAKAYRRMVVEAKKETWVEMLRKGSWGLVCAASTETM